MRIFAEGRIAPWGVAAGLAALLVVGVASRRGEPVDPAGPTASADAPRLRGAPSPASPARIAAAPAEAATRPRIRSRPQPWQLASSRPDRCSAAASGMGSPSRLDSQTASYLGSGATDTINAVEIAADCSVLVAGRLAQAAGAAAPAPLVPGVAATTGVLAELVQEGRSLRRQRGFGAVVNDLATNAGDAVLVGGDAGLASLGADLQTVHWHRTDLGAATRVALADDGTAAALFGKTLRIFDAQGATLASLAFGDSAVNDVAIDASGVYVTGFAQRDGGPCSQLQVAWVRAFTRTGTERWKAWDWTHAQAAATSSSCADSRGMRIATGRDGGLYFAAESAGGNTIFRFQSRDLAAAAPNVATDAFNTGYNTASNHITYIARLDPADGRVLSGQLILSRLSDGKGNTIRPRAIDADEQGRVYVAGVSACCTQNRSALTFNSTTLAAYAGGDPFVLVLSPDLRTRLLWFSAANGGKGEALGVAASRGLAVLASRADAAPMTLDRAVQATRPATATSSGHVLSWSVATP
jgi:hypothetical protein